MDTPTCGDCNSAMTWEEDVDIEGNPCGEYVCLDCREFRKEEQKDKQNALNEWRTK